MNRASDFVVHMVVNRASDFVVHVKVNRASDFVVHDKAPSTDQRQWEEPITNERICL